MTGVPTRRPPRTRMVGWLARQRGVRPVLEHNLLRYQKVWLVILAGFLEPVFYLFAIGIGLGQLVGEVPSGANQAVSYAAFVAPGLLAAAAMNGAIWESTNVFFKLRYDDVYKAMLATPIEPRDIAIGEIAFGQLRGFAYAGGFLAVMAALGLVASPLALLALPAIGLVGFAFAGLGMAAVTWMRSYLDFDYVQLATLPLFLFSATFFPVEVYPPALRWVVQLSPLYHGVALLRGLTLGTIDAAALGHVGFLVGAGGVGIAIARRRIEGLLRT